MKLKIVLVRHGHSLGNKENRLSGWTDVPLTEEGIKELEELKELYHYPETDYYFASDLQRAYKTAEIIYPDKNINQLEKFREINFGVYENKNTEELDFDSFFQLWLSKSEVQEGENYFQFSERVLAALHELNRKLINEGVASYTLVSHSGIMRAIYFTLLKKDYRDFFRIHVPNGLGYELEIEYVEDEIRIIDIRKIRRKEEI